MNVKIAALAALGSFALGVAVTHTLYRQQTERTRQTLARRYGWSCQNTNITCKRIKTREEAEFYLEECGQTRLDRDRDGRPCETITAALSPR